MSAGAGTELEGRDWPELAAMDVASRVDQVRQTMAEDSIEIMIVTKSENVRWLTGFTGSNGRLVVTHDAFIAITDGRYREQITNQLDQAGVAATIEITTTEVGDILAAAIAPQARVGLEANHVTWKDKDQMVSWLPERELIPLDAMIEELRKLKDQGERARLAQAAAIADLALAEVEPLLALGPTERAVAQYLDNLMADLGADEPSFETIVASGPNSAMPHASPRGRVIEPRDLVIIDIGARVDGYGSDMTRTFVAGGTFSAEQARWYNAVAEAQAAGIDVVSDGVEIRSVDAACREVLAEHGLADAFVHSTGHGIGLEIHEDPILSARTDGILRAGYVVTVEPGVYLPPVGGVRIEDSVVVEDTGCQPITLSPKTAP
ncbi:MAG: M24 family metallopeptidase [Actinomycetia bacterium]|nr:M24 family metallopeptidase [Actinomycetes bacterium]